MIETTLSMLRLAVLVLAAGPLVYYLLSLYCTVEYFLALRRSPPRDDSFAPPVSILKPVRGVDHGAYENFGVYHDELVRTERGWQVARRRADIAHERGDRPVMGS